MQIVELGDYSMVIMKDSEDPPWVSIGDAHRAAKKIGSVVVVAKEDKNHHLTTRQFSSDSICTAGRLVLLFEDSVDSEFHLHDKVYLF